MLKCVQISACVYFINIHVYTPSLKMGQEVNIIIAYRTKYRIVVSTDKMCWSIIISTNNITPV